jgi:hypothetical protein
MVQATVVTFPEMSKPGSEADRVSALGTAVPVSDVRPFSVAMATQPLPLAPTPACGSIGVVSAAVSERRLPGAVATLP